MPLTIEQREQIKAEALSWAGTPYRGWSCLKGCGTDCGQYIYGVYRALGLVPELELPKDYSLQVAKHRESTEYVDYIRQYFREITREEAQPGDLVAYRFRDHHAIAHAAIIYEWPNFLLHAEARNGVSGTEAALPMFRRAESHFFTLKDEFCEGGL